MESSHRERRCPTCGLALDTDPTRRQECPHCGSSILVRNGELVTEEQATIADWLSRLQGFGVTRNDLEEHRKELSKRFGMQASVNDTVWRILDRLARDHASNNAALETIYRWMSTLVSSEGKDPTMYLVEAEKARRRYDSAPEAMQKQVFLGQDELRYIRRLRKEGDLDRAEELLVKAEPSPAVLDELRKVASTRARAAKRAGDWEAVVRHLESYAAYAAQWSAFCIKTVNQEPPAHSQSDTGLLEEARQQLASQSAQSP